MALKKGDVVVLNSGGMKMTVEDVVDELADCIWFDAKNALQRGAFEEAVLTVVPELTSEEMAKLIAAAL